MSRSFPRPVGFTLIEMLLALAIVGLMASLVLPGLGPLLRTIDRTDPDLLFREAITSARQLSLESNREVVLRFNPAKHHLEWTNGERASYVGWPPGARGQLLPAQRGATLLSGGQLEEAGELDFVRFHPDGTCDDFRTRVRHSATAVRTIVIDRWTCAEIVAREAGAKSP